MGYCNHFIGIILHPLRAILGADQYQLLHDRHVPSRGLLRVLSHTPSVHKSSCEQRQRVRRATSSVDNLFRYLVECTSSRLITELKERRLWIHEWVTIEYSEQMCGHKFWVASTTIPIKDLGAKTNYLYIFPKIL